MDVLDYPAWAAMTGPQAHLAERRGQVARFRADVSPFLAFAPDPDEHVWADLRDLVGPGEVVLLPGVDLTLPADWEVVMRDTGVQLVDSTVDASADPSAEPLGPADVPEMLDLVERTRPGPFLPGTIEMGGYLGIRRHGKLVAMAGERLRPPGWSEISAVCTDPAHRGQGLASRLVRAVAAAIRARGETPFMHAAASNTGAVRLYESLGFTLRRTTTFSLVRVPA